MRGRIKRYFSDKGYGFIAGEDGVDYYFHISNVRTAVQITQGSVVEFDVVRANDKKNNKAVNIKIIEVKDRPQFIQLGGTRVKLSNIKNYGISSNGKVLMKAEVKTYTECIVVDCSHWFFNKEYYDYEYHDKHLLSFDEYYDEIEQLNYALEKGYDKSECDKDKMPKAFVYSESKKKLTRAEDKFLEKDDFILTYADCYYLYVTTYQGDNYTFYEYGNYHLNDSSKASFNIREKLQELDSYFTK